MRRCTCTRSGRKRFETRINLTLVMLFGCLVHRQDLAPGEFLLNHETKENKQVAIQPEIQQKITTRERY